MIYSRVAVKVGSNVLTRADGTLDITRMSALVDQIADLRRAGIDVILISSGAVASGRSEMHLPATETAQMDSVEQRQLFSAVGQAKLMGRYVELFRDHGLHVGQVLTMKENFSTPEQNQNQRQCMAAMLAHGVLPIVNENDTVCITELMFTDNDELSGLVARLMDCQALIILSTIDGIYDGSPSDPASKLIREVQPTDDLSALIRTEKSSSGRGGMQSKYATAREVASAGIHVYIANGKRENILLDVICSPDKVPFTHFNIS
ncbi:MAG: glutamate 5-kinase [Bacteroidaceae bacterium]|nr:glutamate 5-kinase [Bacteroidaceae bacterium]